MLTWLGYDVSDAHGMAEENGIPIAAVIRVSSDGQARAVGRAEKSSLEHQEERVADYISDRWGDSANVTWYRSIGSGMNFERKELLQLIQDILAGKYRGGFIVATDLTRIARFGHKLIEFIAARRWMPDHLHNGKRRSEPQRKFE